MNYSLSLKIGWSFVLLLLFNTVTGQGFVNDAGAREKHFVYEVKQIDEFFERFNDDTSSFIRKQYAAYHIKYALSREQLIKSLFNYESRSWDTTLINQFLQTVININKPSLLDFYGEGWYAEANCRFEYNGAMIEIHIILRIEADGGRRAKWMIAAVKSNSIKQDANVLPVADPAEKIRFISPASHANSFIELGKAFEDKEHLSDYFNASFFKRANSIGFYNALLKNRIRFITVKDIRYHYLQVDQWIFTVENFSRKALNSGWLINQLRNVTESEKNQYLKKLLEE